MLRPPVEPIDRLEDVVVFALGDGLAWIIHSRVSGDRRCEADFGIRSHAAGQGSDFSSGTIVEIEGRGKLFDTSANAARSQAKPGVSGKQGIRRREKITRLRILHRGSENGGEVDRFI